MNRRVSPFPLLAPTLLLSLVLPFATLALRSPATGPEAAEGAAAAGSVSGKVTLVGADGKPEANASGAVVYVSGAWRRTAAGAARNTTMVSRNKSFEPHVVAVAKGQTVDFPNLDKIHHNVFSVTEPYKFDLGLYKNGASRSKTFDATGACRVFCNIHAQMAGIVVVTDGDASAVTGADGAYRIEEVPPGRYTIVVWYEKGEERREEIEIPPGASVTRSFRIDVSGYRESPHTNKYGEPYGKDDEARY